MWKEYDWLYGLFCNCVFGLLAFQFAMDAPKKKIRTPWLIFIPWSLVLLSSISLYCYYCYVELTCSDLVNLSAPLIKKFGVWKNLNILLLVSLLFWTIVGIWLYNVEKFQTLCIDKVHERPKISTTYDSIDPDGKLAKRIKDDPDSFS